MRRSVSPACRGELRAQALREAGEVGRRVEQAVVEQLVEQQRVAGDELRRPARGADDARHALERVGLLGEQREVGGAAGDRLEQVDAARERRLGVGRARRRARQRRHQRVEAPARVVRQRGVALARAQRGEARMLGPGFGALASSPRTPLPKWRVTASPVAGELGREGGPAVEPHMRATRPRSSASSGRSWRCASSRYCRRCSTLRRNT